MPDLDSGKKKIIRDPVHGYIEIAGNIFNNFIDTKQFQRLHHIRQGNIQVLYPSATHTRFEHSIGVFHLGRSLFRGITEKQDKTTRNSWKKYRSTIELACLLHDIGHAPLSHIGESFYSEDNIQDELKRLGVNFAMPKKPARHELMSCLVALTIYSNKLDEYGIDKDFFCRLITGVEYEATNTGVENYSLKNAFINILSGAFDVDKMDYIMRDAQSAGISNINLDVQRIINAFNIIKKDRTYIYVIEKTGFSAINQVIGNRNHLYYWVHSHHKVRYHSELLRRYLKAILKEYGNEFKKLFSFEAITGSVKTDLPFATVVNLVDDSDILCLMKNLPVVNNAYSWFYQQIFERKHFKPLWKTKIEYDEYLKEQPDILTKRDFLVAKSKDDPEHNIEKEVLNKAKGQLIERDFMIFTIEPKPYLIEKSREAKVYLPGYKIDVKDFVEIFTKSDILPEEASKTGLYIFVHPEKQKATETMRAILHEI